MYILVTACIYTRALLSPSLSFSLCVMCTYTGGAGGKGTWGKLVEVYDDDGHTHDQRDPNYDSEEEVVSYVTISRVYIIYYTATLCVYLRGVCMLKHTLTTFLLPFLSVQETYTVSPSSPHLSIEDFRKQAMAIFKEYFEHGDTADVTVSDTNSFYKYIIICIYIIHTRLVHVTWY